MLKTKPDTLLLTCYYKLMQEGLRTGGAHFMRTESALLDRKPPKSRGAGQKKSNQIVTNKKRKKTALAATSSSI